MALRAHINIPDYLLTSSSLFVSNKVTLTASMDLTRTSGGRVLFSLLQKVKHGSLGSSDFSHNGWLSSVSRNRNASLHEDKAWK
jgi:hypothetical protein